MIAIFLSHCMHIIATPEDDMYPTLMRFLLQRPTIDVNDVPLFYSLFFSTGNKSSNDRVWLLHFLTESMHSVEVKLICYLNIIFIFCKFYLYFDHNRIGAH